MKVLLVHGGSCESELKQVRAWLEAENCEIAIFDLSGSGSVAEQHALTESVNASDAVTFLVNPKLPTEDVQIAVLAAVIRGKPVTSIQLGEPIPLEALEKYGSGSVPLKHNLVVATVCRNAPEWRDQEEELREEPETERHKCKKQKPKKRNAAA